MDPMKESPDPMEEKSDFNPMDYKPDPTLTDMPDEIKLEIAELLCISDIYNLHWAEPAYSGVASEMITKRYAAGKYRLFTTTEEYDKFWESVVEDKPFFEPAGPRSTFEGRELLQVIKRDQLGLMLILNKMGMPFEGYTHSGWTTIALAVRYNATRIFKFLAARSPDAHMAIYNISCYSLFRIQEDVGLLGLAAWHAREDMFNRLLDRMDELRARETRGNWNEDMDDWADPTFDVLYMNRQRMPIFYQIRVPCLHNTAAERMLEHFRPETIVRADAAGLQVVESVLESWADRVIPPNPWLPVLANRDWRWMLDYLVNDPDMRDEVRPMINSGTVTPLMEAARRRDTDQICALMGYGADPNVAATDGLTAMHVVLNKHPIQLSALGVLMDRVRNPNMGETWNRGTVLLHLVRSLERLRRRGERGAVQNFDHKLAVGHRAARIILRCHANQQKPVQNVPFITTLAERAGLLELSQIITSSQHANVWRSYNLRYPSYQLDERAQADAMDEDDGGRQRARSPTVVVDDGGETADVEMQGFDDTSTLRTDSTPDSNESIVSVQTGDSQASVSGSSDDSDMVDAPE